MPRIQRKLLLVVVGEDREDLTRERRRNKVRPEDLGRKTQPVLSGVGNDPTYNNFKQLGKFHSEREESPFLRASTPLIPGYIDLEEIEKIARFISEVDSSIPYSLLAFEPAYRLGDLPTTERDFALEAKNTTENEGLERVRVGNKHLLR